MGKIAVVLMVAGGVVLAKPPVKPPEFVALTSSKGSFHPVFRRRLTSRRGTLAARYRLQICARSRFRTGIFRRSRKRVCWW
jgi:hypothetical protein